MWDTHWAPVSGPCQYWKEELILLGWAVSHVQPQPSSLLLAGIHPLRVGLARALPAQPCLPSGNAYTPVRHFFKVSKPANFTPNEMRSSWWSRHCCAVVKVAGVCLPRAVAPGLPFPHGREALFHRRNSQLQVWRAPKTPGCTEEPWKDSILIILSVEIQCSRQQWWLYRLYASNNHGFGTT